MRKKGHMMRKAILEVLDDFPYEPPKQQEKRLNNYRDRCLSWQGTDDSQLDPSISSHTDGTDKPTVHSSVSTDSSQKNSSASTSQKKKNQEEPANTFYDELKAAYASSNTNIAGEVCDWMQLFFARAMVLRSCVEIPGSQQEIQMQNKDFDLQSFLSDKSKSKVREDVIEINTSTQEFEIRLDSDEKTYIVVAQESSEQESNVNRKTSEQGVDIANDAIESTLLLCADLLGGTEMDDTVSTFNTTPKKSAGDDDKVNKEVNIENNESESETDDDSWYEKKVMEEQRVVEDVDAKIENDSNRFVLSFDSNEEKKDDFEHEKSNSKSKEETKDASKHESKKNENNHNNFEVDFESWYESKSEIVQLFHEEEEKNEFSPDERTRHVLQKYYGFWSSTSKNRKENMFSVGNKKNIFHYYKEVDQAREGTVQKSRGESARFSGEDKIILKHEEGKKSGGEQQSGEERRSIASSGKSDDVPIKISKEDVQFNRFDLEEIGETDVAAAATKLDQNTAGAARTIPAFITAEEDHVSDLSGTFMADRDFQKAITLIRKRSTEALEDDSDETESFRKFVNDLEEVTNNDSDSLMKFVNDLEEEDATERGDLNDSSRVIRNNKNEMNSVVDAINADEENEQHPNLDLFECFNGGDELTSAMSPQSDSVVHSMDSRFVKNKPIFVLCTP